MDKSKKKTLVVGLGKTGLSVARYLQQNDCPFMMADSRRPPPTIDLFADTFPDVELHLGAYDSSLLQRSREIIVSPGVPLHTPLLQAAVAQGLAVYGDIELFARAVSADKTILAITGTNGKSTVVSLLTRMAHRAGRAVLAGGNLGTPALDLLDHQDADMYVLELSSFQLETLSCLRPAVATILNVSADHLDRYDSFAQYVQAKCRIYQGSEAVAINRQQPLCSGAWPPTAKIITYGLDRAQADDFGVLDINGEIHITQGQQPWIAAHELSGLYGKTGLLNAQAALAVGWMAGLPRAAMLEALRRFESLPHRMQQLGYYREMLWINDSKATNVAATVAALQSLCRPCLWIAGGAGKRADFSDLRQAVQGCVQQAFFIGADAAALRSATEDVIATEIVDDLEQAVQRAAAQGRSGDCVLLSPACSSLDCYQNYKQRGNHFMKLFSELKP